MLEALNCTQELDGIIGRRLIYVYNNGWKYEMYIKNEDTIDYRIHSGMVGGRWVKDQKVFIVRIARNTYKISWDEPTGTAVSLSYNLDEMKIHGVIFFPRWIAEEPMKTVCFQNDHLDLMRSYRDAGPTYPKLIVDEFASISLIQNVGIDREDIVACPPDQMPVDFLVNEQCHHGQTAIPLDK
jgi:phenolic acid decarboxylase